MFLHNKQTEAAKKAEFRACTEPDPAAVKQTDKVNRALLNVDICHLADKVTYHSGSAA